VLGQTAVRVRSGSVAVALPVGWPPRRSPRGWRCSLSGGLGLVAGQGERIPCIPPITCKLVLCQIPIDEHRATKLPGIRRSYPSFES
jgi:hypothetical protein